MAIKAQGATVKVSTAEAAADTITGISKADPAVVTATNTYTAGDIVVIDGVVGMTEVNGRAFIVANPTGTSFELRGVDSTGYTTYTSGGTSTKQTMTVIDEVRSLDRQPGEADEIPTEHLKSTRKTYLPGLPDSGNWSFEINLDLADAGQQRLAELERTQSVVAFSVELSNSYACAFTGFVKAMPSTAQSNDAVRGSVSVRESSDWSGWSV